MPTQTVLRQTTRCVIAGERRIARCLQSAKNIRAARMNTRQTLGITGRGPREALKRKCRRRRFSAHETAVEVPLSRFDALPAVLYDVEQGYLREGSKIRLPQLQVRFAVA